MKKFFKITLIVLGILLVLLFTLPFLFKGKIINIAKTEINKNLNARVDFKDIDISFFRRFPRLAVGLENIQVIGTDDFSKDTLIAAKQIDVALNLMSLFRGDEMKIYSVTIDNPRIHAIVDKNGKANWDIVKPGSDTTSSSDSSASFNINLQHYAINHGYISYIDVPGDMSSEIIDLNHSGSGDFTSDLFTLKTNTSAESLSFTYAKIPYLVNTKTNLDLDIEIDNKVDKYTFKTDDIVLNDLKLSSEGYFQFVNDTTYGMDIKFNAPSTEFKTLLSLIPAVYKNDFNKIKTSGNAIFNGFVKGEYNSVKMPAYNINLNVQNGFFQYPDLPQPVKNIDLDIKVNNPDGITDHTVVDISKGHIEFGNDPFDFRLLLKNPVTSQYIDAAIKGKLNLAQVTQFVKLSGDTKLSGLVEADATAKGNVAVIAQQKPGTFTANGFINISGLNYSSNDFPQPVRNSNIQIRFNNPDGVADHTVISIPAAHVELGNDPIDFNLLIKNPATNLAFDGNAKGRFNLASVAQFTTLEPGTKLSGILSANISFKGNKTDIDKKDYQKINTSGTLNLTDINYASKDYPDGVKLNEAVFTFNPKNITLNSAKAEYLKSIITANGSVDNAIGYALKDEPIAGTLNIHADKVNLNDFMGTTADSTSADSSAAPFAVPKNIAFVLNASVDKLVYDKTEYSDLNGSVAIKDETILLKNVQMNALDGKIAISGSYSTLRSKKTPDISLTYDLNGLSAEKTFYAFNTVQKLMPVGKFISGKISSQLTVKGKLGENMTPEINTLTGEGNLLLIDGALKKFGPMEKLAQALNVNELNGFTLKDIKNYFEFANGKVLVKPFHVKVKDIDMEIGGMHGLDQSMNYAIQVKLPRAMMGTKGNELVNNLVTQANSRGVPVKLSDVVTLNAKMLGTITNPNISFDLKESVGSVADDVKAQATEFIQAKTDSAKKVINDTLQSLKKEAVKDLTDRLKAELFSKKDTVAADSSKKPENPADRLKESGKGLIENINPFKKKK